MSVCMPCLSVSKLAKQTQQLAVTDFGDMLEFFMLNRGWNQDQLSNATDDPNVSQGQISNYKYGRRNPSRKTVRVLARALARGIEDEEASYQTIVNTLLQAAGYAEDFPGVGLHYPTYQLLRHMIRESGIDDKIFVIDELENMMHSFEIVIEGYAAKKQRQPHK